MKVLLGILLVLFSTIPTCFSQIISDDTVHLITLPHEGILLDKGWKFHGGDNSVWADPEFNDENWQSINPSLDIHHIPQIHNVPIFWLRLHLLVDSSLIDQPIGMTVSQVGASEIYLDGTLIYKFGVASKDIKNERTNYLLNCPYSIKLGQKKMQTISIRYSFSPNTFLIKYGYINYCLRIELNKVDQTFLRNQKQTRSLFIRELSLLTLRLMFSFLCLALYFSYPVQKAYLYFGTRSLMLGLGGMLGGLIALELTNTSLVFSVLLTSFILTGLSTLFALKGMYMLFNQRKNWLSYVVHIYSLVALISFFLFYDQAENIYGVYFLLYSLEFARVCLKAIRLKRAGAVILFINILSFFFFLGCTIIAVNYNALNAAFLFIFIGVAIDPLAWSLFIAGEFARTGLGLQARVREVEQLSKKAIEQEQEKQQLLAGQNETLEKKVYDRTSQLNASLIDLRSTQAQLIQSEKMASLGELTAGIAHEIQNPLNFVNNFSDLNKELIDEASKANEDGNSMEVKDLLLTLKNNEEKINHHGRRADSIVKGMLQHSRTSTGQKESTDLNRLIDEYFRLSYQGLRTKDNTFSSKMETNLDPTIMRISVIPQDIGRVLLNLYNNAFYAVSEKKKRQFEGYDPNVTVSTLKTSDGVEIRIRDNGDGIHKNIIDKIFQPFFTTKPTGQGTGLGLSLSYDIIKAHGGEIKVNTDEGKFTEFTITLYS